MLFAFESSGKGTLPFEGWTLGWFREVLDDEVMVQAFRTSAVVGVTTALLAVVIGTLAAYAMHRYRSRTGRLVVSTATLPLAFPYLVLGIALLSMFRVLDVRLSTNTIVVGHLLITLPVVLVTVERAVRHVRPGGRGGGPRPRCVAVADVHVGHVPADPPVRDRWWPARPRPVVGGVHRHVVHDRR